MKKFTCVVKQKLGIHARPASDIAALARAYKSSIQISLEKRSANAKRIVELMEMNIGSHDEITVTIEGIDEEVAYDVLYKYCEHL